jgi:hypothetical protein
MGNSIIIHMYVINFLSYNIYISLIYKNLIITFKYRTSHSYIVMARSFIESQKYEMIPKKGSNFDRCYNTKKINLKTKLSENK